ncbi:MAG: hypothetical protein KDC46_15190 [Thermoleophilia bacterium]|nr:hypothetical protein [Thermoleophilia bacterium]
MQIEAVAPTTIVPMPDGAQHALAATWALARAGYLLNPVGIPENPPTPDVPGARDAFREAVWQLEEALKFADGLPGHEQVQAALEEANEALMHLTKPGVKPPIADVVEHAWKGGELAREAVLHLGGNPDEHPTTD